MPKGEEESPIGSSPPGWTWEGKSPGGHLQITEKEDAGLHKICYASLYAQVQNYVFL